MRLDNRPRDGQTHAHSRRLGRIERVETLAAIDGMPGPVSRTVHLHGRSVRQRSART